MSGTKFLKFGSSSPKKSKFIDSKIPKDYGFKPLLRVDSDMLEKEH